MDTWSGGGWKDGYIFLENYGEAYAAFSKESIKGWSLLDFAQNSVCF